MRNIENQKVLVTGADGFIGSHLVEALVQRGAKVRAFTCYNSFNSKGWLDTLDSEVMKHIDFFAGDIRDPNGVREAIQGVEIIFHLAALIGIPFSYHSPDSYVDTNIKGTLNILQAARAHGVKRLVHTSTSEVYGTAQVAPITEDHPINPQSPYAATKAAADQLALSFYRSFGTPVVILRPFNAYGPRQSLRAVIPTIITQLHRGVAELKLGITSATRDFTYVTDLVQAFIQAGTVSGIDGSVIHTGAGYEISIGSLANKIADIMSKKVVIIQDEERFRPENSEVQRLLSDPSKAQELLGWSTTEPGLAGLTDGLEKAITWYTQPDNFRWYADSGYVL